MKAIKVTADAIKVTADAMHNLAVEGGELTWIGWTAVWALGFQVVGIAVRSTVFLVGLVIE